MEEYGIHTFIDCTVDTDGTSGEIVEALDINRSPKRSSTNVSRVIDGGEKSTEDSLGTDFI